MKAFEADDWTPEEVALLERALSSRPNGERVYKGILEWLGEKMFNLAEGGEVLSCYHEETEQVLHLDPMPDAMRLIPGQRQPERDRTYEDFGRAVI